MSYNPSYCWILGLALGPFFTQKERGPQGVPKTITQLYSYYIYNILKNHGREIESPRDVLLRVGQMTYTGVSEKKIVFTDGDLIKYNLQPSQFLSGFLLELLEREDCARRAVYIFPHLTIQEFVAVLAQFLTPDPGDILKLLAEAHREQDGRFEVFIRFVAGLSSPGSARGLEEFLGPFLHQTTCRVIDWVKEEVKRQTENTESEAGRTNLLNALHYLFESQNNVLAKSTVEAVETLSLRGLRLTPVDCAVLTHAIRPCGAIQHLDLDLCYIHSEGLVRLDRVLHKCQELGLANNELGDLGMKPMFAALRNPECKIQKLRLGNNGLTATRIQDLASALTANSSLTELDMKDNRQGDAGVKRLSVALSKSECKIQKLGLKNNSFTACGAKDLVSALGTNRSLTQLELDNNKLEDSGVKLLSDALRNRDCKIQDPRIRRVGLTASGTENLTSAIGTNLSLTDLALSYNTLGDSGVKLMFAALRKSECKIQKLRLWDVALTDSCSEDLAAALNTNCSLKLLSLGDNRLGDPGVKRLSEVLGNPQCKLQELDLYSNGLTDSCTEYLSSVLRKMRSLKVLDLGANSVTDKSAQSFRKLIEKRKSLKQITLVGNRFTADGQNQLMSLRGIRRGMSIKCSI
ncbi:NACHT, LRR and PYD domains-containing protein 3-like [Pristis pectinata]|uniref:NACHT, LRR and PYD domains-containing protein 3-like n=1 Tax=Pristis pectinata TaxID=685728 RepID=UPI00223DAA14|nr:NACHT, LRR and PYD domains-containing protein 3-like [Pristis pectinata]